jgi:NAD(P)-dependent dehydrogenase (short-subunit alcohol dehydrogenase family)
VSTDQNTGRVAVITGASSGIGAARGRRLFSDVVLRAASGKAEAPDPLDGSSPAEDPNCG